MTTLNNEQHKDNPSWPKCPYCEKLVNTDEHQNRCPKDPNSKYYIGQKDEQHKAIELTDSMKGMILHTIRSHLSNVHHDIENTVKFSSDLREEIYKWLDILFLSTLTAEIQTLKAEIASQDTVIKGLEEDNETMLGTITTLKAANAEMFSVEEIDAALKELFYVKNHPYHVNDVLANLKKKKEGIKP